MKIVKITPVAAKSTVKVLALTSKGKMPKAAKSVVAPVAPVAPVALRGGPAVQAVVLTGKPYRSAAAHNTDWWKLVTAQASTGPATVAGLLAAKVPAHFIGYTMRRGYLTAA